MGDPVMSVSSSGGRTWEQASSPSAVRLAREYEQAWRDSEHRRHRPDPGDFLQAAGRSRRRSRRAASPSSAPT